MRLILRGRLVLPAIHISQLSPVSDGRAFHFGEDLYSRWRPSHHVWATETQEPSVPLRRAISFRNRGARISFWVTGDYVCRLLWIPKPGRHAAGLLLIGNAAYIVRRCYVWALGKVTPMPETPLAIRAEVHGIFPYPDGQRMMLHVETDRGRSRCICTATFLSSSSKPQMPH
jgi:hypothetical protein